MNRFFRFLMIATGLALGFAAYSYLGARMTVGEMLGPESPLSGRTIEFNYHGVPDLPGHPRAWVFTYRRSQLPGITRAQIFVSYNAQLIATRPADLPQRIDTWEKARMP